MNESVNDSDVESIETKKTTTEELQFWPSILKNVGTPTKHPETGWTLRELEFLFEASAKGSSRRLEDEDKMWEHHES